MATELKLHCLGEPLVRGMLQSISSRGKLAKISCAKTGESFKASIADIKGSVSFVTDAHPIRVAGPNCVYSLDGMHKIDVFAFGTGGVGIAIEVKLGLDRLRGSTIVNELLRECRPSKHSVPRLNGRMAAVLDRRFPWVAEELTCLSPAGLLVNVGRPWWLVIREVVWRSWKAATINAFRHARFMVFEELIEVYGGRRDFEVLVTKQVGNEFYDAWGLSPSR